MSHNHVLTVSLSGIGKCLFSAEKLAFLAESKPQAHLLAVYLLYVVLVQLWLWLSYGYDVSL